MKRKIPAAIAVAVEFVAFSSFIVPAIDFYKLGGLIQAVILCVAMGVMSATWKTIAGTWQKVNPADADEPPSKKKKILRIIFALWLLGGCIYLIYIYWDAGASWKDIYTMAIGVPTQSETTQAQSETKQARSDEPRSQKASSLDFDSMSNEELMAIANGKPQPMGTAKRPEDMTDEELDARIAELEARQQPTPQLKQQAQNDDFPDVAKAEKDMMETFINGASLIDAINLHSDRPDPSLANYNPPKRNLPLVSAKRQNTKYATDVLIRYAELAGFSVGDIDQAKAHSGGDPYKMYDFLQGLAEKHLAE